jgi:hypothetical protein
MTNASPRSSFIYSSFTTAATTTAGMIVMGPLGALMGALAGGYITYEKQNSRASVIGSVLGSLFPVFLLVTLNLGLKGGSNIVTGDNMSPATVSAVRGPQPA